MTIFSKKSQHFLSSKKHFLCMFNPKFDKNCAKRAQKKSIFPPIFAWNNWFSQETQAIWKKLKQLLGKTQENIQKLKQNEHQVLSCSQKKCKIKTPVIVVTTIIGRIFVVLVNWRRGITKVPASLSTSPRDPMEERTTLSRQRSRRSQCLQV